MEMTKHYIDLVRYQDGEPIVDVIDRQQGETWLVSHDAVQLDRPVVWKKHLKESHVLIPLVPYIMQPRPEQALAFMLQLGMRCSFDVGRPIRRLHIAIGAPVNQFVDDPVLGSGWQFHVGFAILLD